MKAIEDEIRYLPQQNYNADTGQLARMKTIVAKLPAPKKKPAPQASAQQTGPSISLSIPNSRPSGRMQEYRGGSSASPIPTTGEYSPARARRVSQLPPCPRFRRRRRRWWAMARS